MGSKSAPATPDYEAAAREQAAASKELTAQQNWANRPTQNTPWSTISWSTQDVIDPGTGQKVTKWTQNQQLSEALQHALNQQFYMQDARTNLAGSFMDRVQKEMGNKPFDWTTINQYTPTGKAIDPNAYKVSPTGTGAQTSVQQQALDTTAPQQLTTGQEKITPTGQQTQGLANTTATTNEQAFAAQRDQIQAQLFARMQPEHDRQTAALQTQLANQGITPGSEAYKQAMQQLGDQQSREQYDAMQTAGTEQARMQQGLLSQQQQAFGQTQAGQAAQNAALQNLFAQQQNAGQFGLSAQQQAFGQDVQAQQAANAAKVAQFQQALQAGQFGNQGLQQLFQQQLAASGQNYSQAMNASNYQNQLRQQAIAEQTLSRNMSLNEMNALTSGQQVQSPSMPGFNTASKSDTPQFLQAAQMQGQANLDSFNAQQQATQGMMSGMMGLGSSAMMM